MLRLLAAALLTLLALPALSVAPQAKGLRRTAHGGDLRGKVEAAEMMGWSLALAALVAFVGCATPGRCR